MGRFKEKELNHRNIIKKQSSNEKCPLYKTYWKLIIINRIQKKAFVALVKQNL